MRSVILDGDLFSTDCKVIAHQVNCMGVMNSGVAKIIKEKYPGVFSEYRDSVYSLNNNCLGGCLLVSTGDKYIANIFGQYLYKGCNEDKFILNSYESPSPILLPSSEYISSLESMRYTNYEAFYRSLTLLRLDMNKKSLKSIAFPYKIGSDRGGASWNIIRSMIDDIFEDTDIVVKIYKLN